MTPLDEDFLKMHWKDRWEYEAGLEYEKFDSTPVSDLVDLVRQGYTGAYFQIWQVIAEKGSVESCALALWEYLRDNPGETNDLNRYHCAGALFKILGLPDDPLRTTFRARVQWAIDGEDARQKALLELKEIIDRHLK